MTTNTVFDHNIFNLYHALTTIQDKGSPLTTGRCVFVVNSIIITNIIANMSLSVDNHCTNIEHSSAHI